MRVCVVGAGIAGLSTAHHLSRHPELEVTLVDRCEQAGGRADVADGNEHCPRIFLDDYVELFELFDQIPSPAGGSILEDLRRITRYCHTERGWVSLSHLYRFRSPEISWRDRLGFALSRTRTPLVADVAPSPNTNRYGSVRNYTLSSAVWVIKNLLRSEYGYAFDRPTDEAMTRPWLAHLREQGVSVRLGTPVTRVSTSPRRVEIDLAGTTESFDAVVLAVHLADVVELVPTTALARQRSAMPHTHCTCITIDIDPEEEVVRRGETAVYSRNGVSVLVQDRSSRAVVMCLRCPTTDPSWVVPQVRSLLALERPVGRVGVRHNAAASEGVHTAEHLPPDKVVSVDGPIWVAGAFLRTSYPLDSAECAARSARLATEKLRSSLGVTSRLIPSSGPALDRGTP